jgi:hypothetical protein
MNFSFDSFYGFKSCFHDLATIRFVIWYTLLNLCYFAVLWMRNGQQPAVMIIQERGKDRKRMLSGGGVKNSVPD